MASSQRIIAVNIFKFEAGPDLEVTETVTIAVYRFLASEPVFVTWSCLPMSRAQHFQKIDT